ncbi:alkaline phosphatase [Anoxybacillus sp. UARK-01]|uniref:DedA family protein n=1 Tax=Anoxybacillus sp. UARK-01 TaxID=1895648 RepID=UPI0009BA49B1|nr:DedA family protein [Anoxybacillus sp. UARK-01]OQM46461.1 alkaline phosphatase [Anoxybacillus sp. UARK-01]
MEQHLHHFIEQFGYIGIMVALAGGVIGLPVPDEVLLTYVGYNVFTGAMSYPAALGCSFIGALLGISVSYYLGIRLGTSFLHKFGPKMHMSEKRIEQAKVLFAKMGPFLLFIGYFVPGIRHVSAFLAGTNEYRFKKFAAYAYTGAFFWVFTFTTFGRILGRDWKNIRHYMEHYSLYLLGILMIGLLIAGYVYYQRITTKENAS